MSSVQAQLAAITKKSMEKAMTVFVRSGIRLGDSIIVSSPVDKGFFRNFWNTEIGRIGYDKSRSEDRSGSQSREQLHFTFPQAELGDFVTFNNPLPYGKRLEYDGWSKQAPNGMVRINTARWDKIVAEEIARVK